MDNLHDHEAAHARTVRIRPAEPRDLPAICDIDTRITGDRKPAYWQDMLRRYGEGAADGHFLVAEADDGVPAGFLIGEVRAWEFGSPPCGWIFAINVDPQRRLARVGTLLYEAVCARFVAAGVRSVRTMVNRKDHLILSFFRSQGMMAGPSIELEKELP